nr:RHS repeat-associated core domain-containing protein [Paenibacillus sp. 481]
MAVIDAEGKRTAYTYNLAGNLVQIQYADGTVLKKRYDEIGRLIEQIDPKNQSKRFYHDANNNLVKSIDRKGQVHQFGYSNRNFLSSSMTGIAEENVSYTYDASGNRTVMTDATGTTNYAYFPTGELQSITYPDKTTLSYEYEVRGLRTKQTVSSPSFSSALTVNYAPLFSHPTSLQVIDRNNKVLEKVKYTYDLSQTNLMELSLSRHISEMYTYDGLNLSGITQILGSIRILENFQYDYDNNRNIILKSESGNSFTFTYDKLNRIQTNSQFNETYTYDARDNRSTLTTTNPPVQKGAQYSYDSRNRLTRAVTEDGNTVTYRYNGDGLMVERSQAGETTRYYYDDRKIIVAEGKVEPNGTVTLMYMYVHDPKGRLLARQVASSNQMQSYLTNGHGDVTEIRDSQGTVLNKYTYDIWGKPLTASELVPNIFRYSSEYWDSTTNLQYLRSRWYDPSIGRFTTEDTYEGSLGSTLSLNLYTYVHNNPLKYTDPSGFAPVGPGKGSVFDRNQWKYLSNLALKGAERQSKWANKQIKNQLYYKSQNSSQKSSTLALPAAGSGGGIAAGAYAAAARIVGTIGLMLSISGSSSVQERERQNTVYRALTAGNAGTLAGGKGILAGNPNANKSVFQHVMTNDSANSQWISTTKSLTVARKFSSGNGIVAIDLRKVHSKIVYAAHEIPDNGSDMNDWARDLAEKDHEYLIHGHIPQSAIMGFVQ